MGIVFVTLRRAALFSDQGFGVDASGNTYHYSQCIPTTTLNKARGLQYIRSTDIFTYKGRHGIHHDHIRGNVD